LGGGGPVRPGDGGPRWYEIIFTPKKWGERQRRLKKQNQLVGSGGQKCLDLTQGANHLTEAQTVARGRAALAQIYGAHDGFSRASGVGRPRQTVLEDKTPKQHATRVTLTGQRGSNLSENRVDYVSSAGGWEPGTGGLRDTREGRNRGRAGPGQKKEGVKPKTVPESLKTPEVGEIVKPVVR